MFGAWHEEATGEGGSLLWTTAHDGSADAVGVFRLSFEASGLYRLEVSTPAAFATTSQADYVVHHAGVSETIRLDQSAADGWRRLGDFLFSGGGDQWVGLGDATGEAATLGRAVVHDALRVTRLDLPGAGDGGVDVDAGVGGDASVMPTSGGGCSVGRVNSSRRKQNAFWLALLALSLVKRRRRRAVSGRGPKPARHSR
jgi:MYXO-CTERM domain-containing protein